jgi:lysophospholipase L1-like esterase
MAGKRQTIRTEKKMMEEERNFELEPYTILCFGDSNTWGCIPRWQDSTDPPHRYPRGVRWTSVLQKQLGDKVNVVEEGLGGRTTLRALPTEEGKEKQGIRYFPPCLQTHRPLDMVILMLGTNDMNLPIQPKEEELGNLMSEMIDVIDHKTKCWRDGKRPQN